MRDKQNALIKITRLSPYLNPALKRVATYILGNPNKVKLQTIQKLAKECKVSESTVTKFVKETNFGSFQKLKIAIAEMSANEISHVNHYNNERKFIYDDIAKTDSIESIINKITYRNIAVLKEAQNSINLSEMEKGASAIERANIIAIYCSGSSTIVGQHAKMRFYRVGKNCLLHTDPVQQAASSSLLKKPSVAIGISSSGRTKSTVDSIKIAKNSGATTICITDSSKSPIVKYADIKIFSPAKHSAFLQDSMVSRMAQILIIDILYACFATRNYANSLKFIERSASVIKKTKY